MLGTFLLYLYILCSLFLIGIKTVMLVEEKRKVLPGQGNRSKNTNRINKATERIALILLVFIITYTPGCFTTFVYLNVAKYNYFILHFVPLINDHILTNLCFNIVIYSTTFQKCRSAYMEHQHCVLQCITKPYNFCQVKTPMYTLHQINLVLVQHGSNGVSFIMICFIYLCT